MKSIAKAVYALFAACWCLSASTSGASAQACDISFDPMNFGQFRLSDINSTIASATVRASCTGQPNETIRLCPSLQNGQISHTQNGAYGLGINLYSDSNAQVALRTGFDVPLDGNGAGQSQVTIYGRMTRFAYSFKAGQYQGLVSLGLQGSYASDPLCSTTAGAARRLPVAAAAKASVKAVAAKR